MEAGHLLKATLQNRSVRPSKAWWSYFCGGCNFFLVFLKSSTGRETAFLVRWEVQWTERTPTCQAPLEGWAINIFLKGPQVFQREACDSQDMT